MPCTLNSERQREQLNRLKAAWGTSRWVRLLRKKEHTSRFTFVDLKSFRNLPRQASVNALASARWSHENMELSEAGRFRQLLVIACAEEAPRLEGLGGLGESMRERERDRESP